MRMIVSTLVVGVLAVGLLYIGIKIGEQKADTTPVVPEAPVKTIATGNAFQEYKDEYLKFYYPSTWKVIKEVPEVYQSKMFDQAENGKCPGPILQNQNQKSSIIVIQPFYFPNGKPSGFGGTFCWSSGSFQGSRWVANGMDQKWMGDMTLMQEIPGNDKNSAFAFLVYQDGKDDTAVSVLYQIVGSVTFLKN